jgi:hypothetical protein
MFDYTGVLHYKSRLPAEIFDSQYAMPITEGVVLGGVLGRTLRENEVEGASQPTDEANVGRVHLAGPSSLTDINSSMKRTRRKAGQE